MAVNFFCSSMEMELTAWKARIYDIIRKIDELPESDKAKMAEDVNSLHKLLADMDGRIKQLRTECPVEWGPMKEEISGKAAEIKAKYEEALESITAYI